MRQEYTLDNNIFEHIILLRDSINERKYWCTFNYTYTFNKISELINIVDNTYFEYSAETLNETSRRIIDKTFMGNLDLYITYYNAILYLTKLRIKVEYHQKYGKFENS